MFHSIDWANGVQTPTGTPAWRSASPVQALQP